jgi:signal peptidase II
MLATVAAVVLTADIVTKALVVAHLRPGQPVHLIGNVLMLWLVRNPGAAFSVGTSETVVFTLIAFGVVIYIARTARRLYSLGWAVALGLLLGGATGNLVDRIFRAPGLFRGDVVDWIAVTRYYPIFNLADSGVVCGGILMVILAMLGYRFDGTRAVYEQEEPAGGSAEAPAEPGAATVDAGTVDAGTGDAGTVDAGEPAERTEP